MKPFQQRYPNDNKTASLQRGVSTAVQRGGPGTGLAAPLPRAAAVLRVCT